MRKFVTISTIITLLLLTIGTACAVDPINISASLDSKAAATLPLGATDKLIIMQSHLAKQVRPGDLGISTLLGSGMVPYRNMSSALKGHVPFVADTSTHHPAPFEPLPTNLCYGCHQAQGVTFEKAVTINSTGQFGTQELSGADINSLVCGSNNFFSAYNATTKTFTCSTALGGGGGGSGIWGGIIGTLSQQLDLQAALDAKSATTHLHTGVYEPANANIQNHVTDTSYHLNATQKTDLTDGGDSVLHYHAADRSRANHTGTQSADTIIDGTSNKAYTAAEKTKLAGIPGSCPSGTGKALRANSAGTLVCSYIVYHATSAADEAAAWALDPPPDIVVREDLLASGPLPTATMTGTPAALTNATTTDVTVGGSSVVSYKYTLDGGSQSAELTTSVHIQLVGLVSGSHTLAVVGKNSGGTWQTTPTSYTWTIDTSVPVTTPSFAAGTYDNSVTVSLSASETATIRYTTDGSTPTGASAIYASSLVISSTTTLKYFATDPAGNAETVKTGVYTINHPPTISGTPAAATQNVAYSWSPTASDPDGNSLSFSLSGAVLPAGLSFNASTGVISGTPTAAGTTTGLIVTVGDGRLSSAMTVQIVVNPNNAVYRSITTIQPANGSVSPAAVTAVVETTGSQVYTYSATGYHLTGASKTAGSGTATVSGVINSTQYNVSSVSGGDVTITPTEAINQWTVTTSQGSNITISPAPTVVTQNWNTTYTVTPTVTAGYNPYYAVNGGAATLISADTHVYTVPDANSTVAYSAQAIPVPSGLAATGQAGQIAVTWNAVSGSNVTGYTLQGSNDYATWSTIYTGSTASYTETGLSGGVTRYYQVRANTTWGSHTGSGAYSSYVSGTTPNITTINDFEDGSTAAYTVVAGGGTMSISSSPARGTKALKLLSNGATQTYIERSYVVPSGKTMKMWVYLHSASASCLVSTYSMKSGGLTPGIAGYTASPAQDTWTQISVGQSTDVSDKIRIVLGAGSTNIASGDYVIIDDITYE